MGLQRRRRQPNERGGRPHRVRVQLSDAQLAALTARADAENVTLARYLVDRALDAPAVSNRAILLELSGVRRLIQTATNNLNQVAKHANSGAYDSMAHATTVERVGEASALLTETLRKLS